MMPDFLRAWLSQRTAGARFPLGDVTLPRRFRGRPACAADAATVSEAGDVARLPHGHDAPGRKLPVLDLGACLFSPEESSAMSGHGVSFTRDHRLASSTRAGLVSSDGAEALVTPLNDAMRRIFGRSLRLRSVSAGSCGGCEAELTALNNVVFDMGRFGIEFVASPRHADGIVVTGAVSRNMRSALRNTYEAVAHPKIVIAVGACALSGGPFAESGEVLGGVPEEIPVDLWIPGCPPHPFTVLDGLLRLLGRLQGAA